MNLENFAKSYLALQGVSVYPASKMVSKPIGDRVPEFVPVVPECERGDV